MAAASRAAGPRTSYAAAETRGGNIALYRPHLRSADAEVLRDAPTVRARARDLVRNNPHAQHAVRISRIAVVGAELRLRLNPDYRFLGIDRVHVDGWARDVERLWRQYAHGPHFWVDAGRRYTFSDLFALIHDQDFIDGEALVVAEWDEARPTKTCFQVIDVDRLSNPVGVPEGTYFKGGVEMDRLGAPVAYHIRDAHPAEYGIGPPLATVTHTRVERETPWYRPIAMHSFQPLRAGQTRGMSEFASAIVALKMGHEYQEMELATANLQASIAAVLTTAANMQQAADMVGEKIDAETGEIITGAQAAFEDSISYYNSLDFTFNGVKVPKLAPGDKLDLVGSKHPTSAYAEFVRNQLYSVAAGLGVDPIALTQDYSRANYASNKMSFAHNGRAAETRRARLLRMIGMPMVGAWLEEKIAAGEVDMPLGLHPEQFYKVKDALVRGTFITSSRAMIEPMKERQAQQLGRALGVETLESMCAEEGESWEDNLEQIARENARAAELGVMLPTMMPPLMPAAPVADDDAADDDAPGPNDPPADDPSAYAGL
jgi:lambda family phage portal protein